MNRREFTERLFIALAGPAVLACSDSKKPIFEKNQVLGCFGDSITAAEEGYVKKLQLMMDLRHPELNLKFLNYGKPSETITGLTEKVHPGPRPFLYDRLDAELNKAQIDVALFCYGINCGIYGPPSEELFESYRKGIDLFLRKMKERDIGVILLTPPPLALDVVFSIQTNAIDDYGYLNPYPEYEKEVLQVFKQIILNIEHRSILAKIDIHSPLFEKRIDCYTDDPIHPNQNGHKMIASTIIEKLGF